MRFAGLAGGIALVVVTCVDAALSSSGPSGCRMTCEAATGSASAVAEDVLRHQVDACLVEVRAFVEAAREKELQELERQQEKEQARRKKQKEKVRLSVYHKFQRSSCYGQKIFLRQDLTFWRDSYSGRISISPESSFASSLASCMSKLM